MNREVLLSHETKIFASGSPVQEKSMENLVVLNVWLFPRMKKSNLTSAFTGKKYSIHKEG